MESIDVIIYQISIWRTNQNLEILSKYFLTYLTYKKLGKFEFIYSDKVFLKYLRIVGFFRLNLTLLNLPRINLIIINLRNELKIFYSQKLSKIIFKILLEKVLNKGHLLLNQIMMLNPNRPLQ